MIEATKERITLKSSAIKFWTPQGRTHFEEVGEGFSTQVPAKPELWQEQSLASYCCTQLNRAIQNSEEFCIWVCRMIYLRERYGQ